MKSTLLLTAFFFAFAPLRAETDPLKAVASELANGIRKQGAAQVAVLPLVNHDNHISDGIQVISDRLTSWLAAEKNVSLVERARLERALSEIYLGQSGTLDPQSVKSLGKSLGADIIVSGTIINLPGEKSEVNARALLSKNGRVIAAGRALVTRTWHERRRLD